MRFFMFASNAHILCAYDSFAIIHCQPKRIRGAMGVEWHFVGRGWLIAVGGEAGGN